MADFQQNFLASLQGGFNIGQQVRGVQDRNKINQLASLAYQAPAAQRQEILGQAAAVDAGQAGALDRQLGNSDDQRNKTMANMAQLLVNAPEQARAGLYQQMVPTLSKYGLQDLPQQYDAQTGPIIDQAARSIYQAYSGGNGASGVQSTYVDNNGQRVAIMRDGSTQILGGNDAGSNQQALTIDVNGTPTQVTFDRRTGRYTNASLGEPSSQPLAGPPAAASAPLGGNHFADFSALSQEFPSATMTSGVRSAERNAQVGGQPNSQHLSGTAADYVVPANQKPAFLSRVRQLGYQAIDEGDHIHVQRSRGGTGVAGQPLVGRRAEDEARAVEQAKTDVQLRSLPERIRLENDGAINRASGLATVEAEAKDSAQRPKRIQSYQQALTAAGNVGTSLDKALGLIGPVSTGFVGARSRGIEGTPAYNLAAELETVKANLGFDRLQQMRDSSPTGGALGAIAVQELVALQSTIANLDPNQSEEQIRANLERVKTHYANWKSAVEQALADEQRAQSSPSGQASQAAPAPASAGASNYSNLWN